MKLPNFVKPYADSLSKNGHDFGSKVVKKFKLSKNCFHKNVILNKYSSMKKNQKGWNDS